MGRLILIIHINIRINYVYNLLKILITIYNIKNNIKSLYRK